METNLSSKTNYLPAVKLPSVLTLIATLPVSFLASFNDFLLISMLSTTPTFSF